MISTLMAVSTDRPRPPRQVNPEVPRALSDLILRLLEKDPADRPAGALEVADALGRIARGEAPALPRARRRAWVAVALAALGLLGAAAAAVLVVKTRSGDVTID